MKLKAIKPVRLQVKDTIQNVPSSAIGRSPQKKPWLPKTSSNELEGFISKDTQCPTKHVVKQTGASHVSRRMHLLMTSFRIS